MSSSKPSQQEIKLAKALVHPEKAIRDETFQGFKNYVTSLQSASEMEFLKIWKALYYCFWLADKQPIQTELAEAYAALIHSLANEDMVLLYIRTFFRIILREWSLLDQYRINKFYILIRIFVRNSLQYFYRPQSTSSSTSSSKKGKKNAPAVTSDSEFVGLEKFNVIFTEEVLTKKPNGVRYHVSDLYLSELINVTKGSLRFTSDFQKILDPFFECLIRHDDAVFLDRVCRAIFENYLDQYSSEEYATYKAEKESSEETPEGEETERFFFQFINTKSIQKRVFDLAGDESTNARFRKRLYDLHKLYSLKTGCPFVTDDMISAEAASTRSEIAKKDEEHKLVIESYQAVSVSGSKRKLEEETTDSKEAGKSVKTPSKEDKKSKKETVVIDTSLVKDTQHKDKKVVGKGAEPEEVIEKVATKKAKKSGDDAAPVTKKVKIDESKNTQKEIDTKSSVLSTKDRIDTPAKPKRPETDSDKAKKSTKSPAPAPAPAAPSTPTSSKSDEAATFLDSPKFEGAKEGYFFGKGGKGLGYYLDNKKPVSAGRKKK